ncbi:hypothetical protein [uncultured Bacteroides sp.]|uniref:hypothetical protein n=1 Tax=uncultured Bacteroides sp. TaxID=162156 RepID=UPI0026774574|nr:hypothetical protein [uncultured Bacteroides sp.]
MDKSLWRMMDNKSVYNNDISDKPTTIATQTYNYTKYQNKQTMPEIIRATTSKEREDNIAHRKLTNDAQVKFATSFRQTFGSLSETVENILRTAAEDTESERRTGAGFDRRGT